MELLFYFHFSKVQRGEEKGNRYTIQVGNFSNSSLGIQVSNKFIFRMECNKTTKKQTHKQKDQTE